MCSGAIGLARIPQVIYGATNQKFGGAGSLYDILADERLNHRVEVETGILEAECAAIMQTFFRQGRERKTSQTRSQGRNTRIKTGPLQIEQIMIYTYRTTVLREAGQEESSSPKRSELCAFSIALDASSPRDADES